MAKKTQADAPQVGAQIITVALDKLVRDPLNVRKQDAGGIAELATSIEQMGLLQNLIVREQRQRGKPAGRFGVVGGGRRLAALQLLAEQDRISKTLAVGCKVVSDAEAVAGSLAENAQREALHPSDLINAFGAMHEAGKSAEEISLAWSMPVRRINAYLALASAAEPVAQSFARDEIDLATFKAIVSVGTPEQQQMLWESLPEHRRDSYSVRQLVSKDRYTLDDAWMRFVGMDAFVAAGGEVFQDLFADSDSQGWYTDRALLIKLANERLEREAQLLTGTANWVKHEPVGGSGFQRDFMRAPTCGRELTDEEHARLAALEEERDRLWELDEQSDAESDRLEAIDQELSDLEDQTTIVDPDFVRHAGCVLSIGADGQLEVSRDMLERSTWESLRDAQRAERAGQTGKTRQGVRVPQADQPACGGLSEPTMAALTAHRTEALRACLADSPAVALRVLTAKLVCLTFNPGHFGYRMANCPLEVRCVRSPMDNDAGPSIKDSPARQALDALAQHLGDQVPGDSERLIEWMLAADDHTVHQLMAYCVATTLNTVQRKDSTSSALQAIAQALDFDAADWWSATAASFFAQVPKAATLAAVAEVKGQAQADSLAKLKKAELCARAEELMAGSRWLPEPLRLTAA